MQDDPAPNSDLTDQEFLRRYEERSLRQFSHQDHLRMAYLYAREGGVAEAIRGARGIRGFAQALGAPQKYHDTLTVGWARVVGHHAVTSGSSSFAEFLGSHPQLMRRDLLKAHYSQDVLASAAARSQFVEPDLVPLP
jgi:hypothetical protein